MDYVVSGTGCDYDCNELLPCVSGATDTTNKWGGATCAADPSTAATGTATGNTTGPATANTTGPATAATVTTTTPATATTGTATTSGVDCTVANGCLPQPMIYNKICPAATWNPPATLTCPDGQWVDYVSTAAGCDYACNGYLANATTSTGTPTDTTNTAGPSAVGTDPSTYGPMTPADHAQNFVQSFF